MLTLCHLFWLVVGQQEVDLGSVKQGMFKLDRFLDEVSASQNLTNTHEVDLLTAINNFLC